MMAMMCYRYAVKIQRAQASASSAISPDKLYGRRRELLLKCLHLLEEINSDSKEGGEMGVAGWSPKYRSIASAVHEQLADTYIAGYLRNAEEIPRAGDDNAGADRAADGDPVDDTAIRVGAGASTGGSDRLGIRDATDARDAPVTAASLSLTPLTSTTTSQPDESSAFSAGVADATPTLGSGSSSAITDHNTTAGSSQVADTSSVPVMSHESAPPAVGMETVEAVGTDAAASKMQQETHGRKRRKKKKRKKKKKKFPEDISETNSKSKSGDGSGVTQELNPRPSSSQSTDVGAEGDVETSRWNMYPGVYMCVI